MHDLAEATWEILGISGGTKFSKITNKYRHFSYFVHIDVLSNLCLCIPKVYFLISSDRTWPSDNKITPFLLVDFLSVSTRSHYTGIAEVLHFSRADIF